jgi:hypothetical protein
MFQTIRQSRDGCFNNVQTHRLNAPGRVFSGSLYAKNIMIGNQSLKTILERGGNGNNEENQESGPEYLQYLTTSPYFDSDRLNLPADKPYYIVEIPMSFDLSVEGLAVLVLPHLNLNQSVTYTVVNQIPDNQYAASIIILLAEDTDTMTGFLNWYDEQLNDNDNATLSLNNFNQGSITLYGRGEADGMTRWHIVASNGFWTHYVG